MANLIVYLLLVNYSMTYYLRKKKLTWAIKVNPFLSCSMYSQQVESFPQKSTLTNSIENAQGNILFTLLLHKEWHSVVLTRRRTSEKYLIKVPSFLIGGVNWTVFSQEKQTESLCFQHTEYLSKNTLSTFVLMPYLPVPVLKYMSFQEKIKNKTSILNSPPNSSFDPCHLAASTSYFLN